MPLLDVRDVCITCDGSGEPYGWQNLEVCYCEGLGYTVTQDLERWVLASLKALPNKAVIFTTTQWDEVVKGQGWITVTGDKPLENLQSALQEALDANN